jgi:hypothetical protein
MKGQLKAALRVADTLDTLTKQKIIGEHFHAHPRSTPNREMTWNVTL